MYVGIIKESVPSLGEGDLPAENTVPVSSPATSDKPALIPAARQPTQQGPGNIRFDLNDVTAKSACEAVPRSVVISRRKQCSVLGGQRIVSC
jgi:hypothetical protein